MTVTPPHLCMVMMLAWAGASVERASLRPGTRQQGREAAGCKVPGTTASRYWGFLWACAYETMAAAELGVAGYAGLWPPASTPAAERLHRAKVCEVASKGCAVTLLPDVLRCVAMRDLAGAHPDPLWSCVRYSTVVHDGVITHIGPAHCGPCTQQLLQRHHHAPGLLATVSGVSLSGSCGAKKALLLLEGFPINCLVERVLLVHAPDKSSSALIRHRPDDLQGHAGGRHHWRAPGAGRQRGSLRLKPADRRRLRHRCLQLQWRFCGLRARVPHA